jgi:hypothetical protein
MTGSAGPQPLASFGLPIVILFSVGSVWISGFWSVLPGLQGVDRHLSPADSVKAELPRRE